MNSKKVALVAGATGLIGSKIVHLLSEDDYYDEIIILLRKVDPLSNLPRVRGIIIDFQNLNEGLKSINPTDVFCCLGTTMKKAGNKEAFKLVDYKYPKELADVTHKNNAKTFLVVSSLGARSNSLFFYNRVKGEVEEALKKIGFQSLYIFRPSLLLGERQEKRLGEDVAKKMYAMLDKIFVGPLKKYSGIEASQVALSMMRMAKSDKPGIVVLESDEIKAT